MIKQTILLVLCLSMMHSQSIPQMNPQNTRLYALTPYTLTYFSAKALTPSAYFEVNFNQSRIIAPNGVVNCTATLNDLAVTTNPICSCLNQICKISLNTAASTNTKIIVNFGLLRNPTFVFSQKIQIRIYFSTTVPQQIYNITISPSVYQPMVVTKNLFNQSDYGVGATDVTYTFNLSLPYITMNPSMQITVPQEVAFGGLRYEISFYGTVQNIDYLQVSSLLVFNLITPENTNPQGFMIVKISGFTNPQFIGTSSSFIFTFLETQFLANCAGCKVAEIRTSLQASSNMPGDIKISTFASSSFSVSSPTNITVNMKLFAPIPVGGKVSIKFPSSISIVLPVSCQSLFGFVIADSSSKCEYNSTSNSIDTVNFAYPFLVAEGSAILVVQVINAPDSRQNSISFQTMDPSGRIIGESRTLFKYSAQPLLLSVDVSKNVIKIQSPVKISVNMTLSQQLGSTDRINLILPYTQNFNYSLTQCTSSSINLNCLTSLRADKQISVVLVPPCVQCKIGSKLTFVVEAFNPSFISSDSESLTIQTISTFGVIQSKTLSISLQVGILEISNYTRNGGATVGSYYNATIAFTVPNFIKVKSGRIEISMVQNSTYYDVITSSNGYQIPYSMQLSNNKPNTITYYQNNKPYSVQSIVVPICSSNQCLTVEQTLTLVNLRQSFNNIPQCCWKVRISTLQGWPIVEQIINTTVNTPAKLNSKLDLFLTSSVATFNSTYTFSFLSPKIPILSPITFTLPSSNTINGLSCFVTTNLSLGYPIKCTITNITTIMLSYEGDPTIMTTAYIQYSLTVNNIANPLSLLPLTYTLQSLYLGPSQQFTTLYTLEKPFPINILLSRSNNTFGQLTILSLNITNPDLYNFTKMVVMVPKNVLELRLTSKNGVSFVENLTHYTIQYTSNSAQYLTLDATNAYSTGISADIIVQTSINGYLSGSGKVNIPKTTPMLLSAKIMSSNQVVGANCSLTITIIRINPDPREKTIKIQLGSNAFSYVSATYLSQKLPMDRTLTVPITTTTITINNLTHLQYIPIISQLTPMTITTLDENNFAISTVTASYDGVVANIPAQGVLDATRSNVNSNTIANILINYIPLYAYTGCRMIIKLPAQQAKTTNSTTCTQNNSCTVLAQSIDSLNITYQKGSPLIINQIINLYPTSDLLSVTLISPDGYIIEAATDFIQPEIVLDPLTISSIIDVNTVSTNCILTLNVSSGKILGFGNAIEILFDRELFTKWESVNPTPCTYTINNVGYSNCTYVNSADGWLNKVTLTYLGPIQIASGQVIQIKLPLTTSWSTIPFANKEVVVSVIGNALNYISQGKFKISSLFSFQQQLLTVAVLDKSFNTSTMVGNQLNSLIVSIKLPVSTPAPNTSFILSLPRDTFTFGGLSESTDTNYYYIRIPLNCAPCSTSLTFTLNVTNNLYQKYDSNSILLGLEYAGYKIINPIIISIPPIIPTQIPGLTSIIRSNNQAYQNTIITIPITLPITLTNLSIKIIGNIQSLLLNLTSVLINNLPMNKNPILTLKTIAIELELSTNNFNITLNGTNMLLVPRQKESYTIMLSNQTHLLYQNQKLEPTAQLIPYSEGINMIRTNTLVNSKTQIYISGSILQLIPDIQLNINNQQYPITTMTFNLSLGESLNPPAVSTIVSFTPTIGNSTHIVYSNLLTLSPALIPLFVPTTINLPNTIYIASVIPITITFGVNVTSKTFTLTSSSFYNSVAGCQACTKGVCGVAISECRGVDGVAFMSLKDGNVDSITFKVNVLQYHSWLPNTKFKLTHQLPSVLYEESKDILIMGNPLEVVISLSSWKVNEQSNYTINIKPLSRAGSMIVSIPQQLRSQSQPTFSTAFTSTYINQTSQNYIFAFPLPTSINVTINNVKNPPDDRPFMFQFFQTNSAKTNEIYGYKQQIIRMKELDEINVYLASRSVAKIGKECDLTLDISTPSYSEKMYIELPISQITLGNNCLISVNNQKISCSYINPNIIQTINQPGRNKYIIMGLVNSKLSVSPSSDDKVKVKIGNPYTRAITTPLTTVFITPFTTAGTITLSQLQRTTNYRLAFTNLNYNITLEHWQESSSLLIQFTPYNYYLLPLNMICQINGQIVQQCRQTGNNTITISLEGLKSGNLTLTISNLINFINDGPYTLTSFTNSVQNSGLLDVYQGLPSNNMLLPSQSQVRILPPYNYVNIKQTILVVFDQKVLNFDNFIVNFTTFGCQVTQLKYNQSMQIQCTFSKTGLQDFSTLLYHPAYSSEVLLQSKSQFNIYPEPTSKCENYMCDLCSVWEGKQYCVSCRERMSSLEGECVNKCPSGYYSNSQSFRCLKCSSNCQTCYGPYSNNCLSCNNILILDSGKCTDKCKETLMLQNRQCVVEDCNMYGCRTCSDNFCYQCLPEFEGQPQCKSYSILPPLLLSYFILPLLGLYLVGTGYLVIGCIGGESVYSWTIFWMGMMEFMSWVFCIVLMPNQISAMVICSFILIRIILSIVSYQIHYSKILSDKHEELLEEEKKDKESQNQESSCNLKLNIVRILANFLGPDAYPLLTCSIGKIIPYTDNKLFLFLSNINRLLVMCILFYLASIGVKAIPALNDKILMSMVGIVSGITILIARILKTELVSKCLRKIY